MQVFTIESKELEALLLKVYQQGSSDTRKAIADKNELDLSAPITAQEFADEYGMSVKTVLTRVTARKIPLILKNPVKFERRYIMELLKSA